MTRRAEKCVYRVTVERDLSLRLVIKDEALAEVNPSSQIEVEVLIPRAKSI